MRRNHESELMKQIADPENLLQAWMSLGGRRAWDEFGALAWVNSEEAVIHISRDLLSGRYMPGPVSTKQIVSPAGEFPVVTVLTLRDRVVQKAFLQMLGPLLDTRFMDCSHAYRKGKGVESAVSTVLQLAGDRCLWIVDADVADFFDSISHGLLCEMLDQDIRASDVCSVLFSWLMAAPGAARGFGLVQGAVISPLLSNVYLHRFDCRMYRVTRNLVRYSDAFLVLCRTRAEAQRCLLAAEKALSDLGLKLHPNKTRIIDATTDRFRFLGHTFVPGDSPPHPRSEDHPFNTRGKRSEIGSYRACRASAPFNMTPACFDKSTPESRTPVPMGKNAGFKGDSRQRLEKPGHSVRYVSSMTGGRIPQRFSAGVMLNIEHTEADPWTLIDDPWFANPPELDS